MWQATAQSKCGMREQESQSEQWKMFWVAILRAWSSTVITGSWLWALTRAKWRFLIYFQVSTHCSWISMILRRVRSRLLATRDKITLSLRRVGTEQSKYIWMRGITRCPRSRLLTRCFNLRSQDLLILSGWLRASLAGQLPEAGRIKRIRLRMGLGCRQSYLEIRLGLPLKTTGLRPRLDLKNIIILITCCEVALIAIRTTSSAVTSQSIWTWSQQVAATAKQEYGTMSESCSLQRHLITFTGRR